MSMETDYSDAGQAGFEQRLRSELGHLTVQVPADMIPRAHRRFRRRLITLRVTAITGTGAVIATAATVVAMASPSLDLTRGDQRAGTTASQSHASRIPAVTLRPPAPRDALSRQQAAGEISWTRTASTSASGVTTVSDTFSYGGTTRVVGFSPRGTLLADQQASVVTAADGARMVASTNVSYADGWVARGTAPAADQASQSDLCPLARQFGLGVISMSVLIASASSLPACPGLTVTRGTRIDGISAVTVSSDVMDVRATLWLNAATGLPIQGTRTSRYPDGRNGESQTVQYGFLPATAANLGYLSAYVPPGFTVTHSAS
ncbi:MAG TPA: hypothetical protein VMG38_22410 [Trebonia sp.]|nr:hypothetical protein [Trebonia sp.]